MSMTTHLRDLVWWKVSERYIGASKYQHSIRSISTTLWAVVQETFNC